MRRFIVRFFALIGLLVVGLIAVGVGLWLIAAPGKPALGDTTILTLDLTQPLPEGASDDGIERALLGEQTTLRDVLDGLERAGEDARVKGIVVRIGDSALGMAQVQELRDAVGALRAKGKFAFAHADSFGELGSGMRSYYLATAFEQIWLQPYGNVGITGIRIEMPFLRGALDMIGIEPRFDHREEYKTAANALTETKMTPAHREETEGLLHSVYGQMVRGIAEGRKLDPERARTLIDEGPFGTQQALDAHLIDHIGYRDDAVAAARQRAGENAQLATLHHYLDRAGRPHQSGPTIAVVYGTGLITRGSDSSSPLSGSTVMGADTITRAFRMATKDEEVKAILFRIDSPGGSATASESIWREALRAKEAGKPVIVSMGNVAASGGYYVAAAADKIVAEPATLTGSIGVVAGKVLVGKLSEKLGITWDSAQLGRNAGIESVVADFTAPERDRFEQLLDEVYAGFKERVAQGRKLSPAAVEEAARGRVWTGEDARARHLVDEFGGFAKALALAKAAAGISADRDVTLKQFPPPANTPAAIIARLLGRDVEPEDAASRAQLTAVSQILVALRPLLREIELASAPPGALVMPPIEIK